MKKYDNVMIETAKLFAKQSYCKRRQVGAVLAKDGRILATGYNGTISGMENKCEEKIVTLNCCGEKVTVGTIMKHSTLVDAYCYKCKCGVRHTYTKEYLENIKPTTNEFTLHAEQNVITYCAKEGISTNGTTLYVTTSPCKQCAKLIAQSGITHVVYLEEYKDMGGIDFLKEVNVTVNHHPVNKVASRLL